MLQALPAIMRETTALKFRECYAHVLRGDNRYGVGLSPTRGVALRPGAGVSAAL
jgi:hypothetical protein